MHRLCTTIAIAVAVAVAPVASASAKKRSRPPQPPVITDDRSIYRPPPLPNEGGRRYYEPQSGPQAPMPRVPAPAPLDPGIRR